jgi:hypothetical protein
MSGESGAFSGIWLKVDRTEQHLDTLKGEIERFLKTKPYGIRADYQERDREVFVFTTVREPCPEMWGVVVGEIAHNLRSALDHLLWEMVVLNTGSAPPGEESQFPIFRTKPGYDNGAGRRIRGVSPEAAALIESLQPFATREDASSPLWHLRHISNFDKHRTLHLTGATFKAGQLFLPPLLPGFAYVELGNRTKGIFEHGTILFRGKLSGPDGFPFQTPDVDVEIPPEFDIAFDERSPVVGGNPVIPTLGAIAARVHETIKRIGTEIFGFQH